MKKVSTLILLTIISLLFFVTVNAQEKIITLSGIIKDSSTQQPLPEASIKITNLEKSEGMYAISDNKGSFIIKNVHPGKYRLKISYIGYDDFIKDEINIKENQQSFILGDIYLALQKNTLQNVSVTASLPKTFIVQTGNKITLNVSQSPIASMSNAYDILLQAPGVMEVNNDIRFRAKSVSVLVDGKATNLSDDDLKTMLSSMPGNNIERIEIIPNPSAKYDSQGGSVINIKLAKNKNYGTSSTIIAGIGSGRFANYNSGITANYKSKKINISSSYNYDYNKQYYDLNSDRTLDISSHIIQNEEGFYTKSNHAYRTGLDYDINKNNSIGIQLKGYSNSQATIIKNNSFLTNNGTKSDTSSSVITNGNLSIFNPSVNVYYKAVLDSLGRELIINADYFNYNKKSENYYQTNYFDHDIKSEMPSFLRDLSPGNNSIKSFTVDYTYPSKIGNFEAGLKTNFTTTDNNISWESLSNNNWINDSSKTNHFVYKENIYAAYLTYDKAFKDKWEINVGIRAEQTSSKGILINSNQINKRDYINLFPNLNLQYFQNLNNIFSFSYRKSIDRFGFDIVNPFIKYQSQYAYYQGNPNIQPQINHNIEFSYAYKQSLVFGLSETHSTNALGPVFLKGEKNSTISSYTNFKNADLFYGYIYYRKEFIKRWTTVLIGGSGFYKYNTSTDTIDQHKNNSAWSYLMQFNNSFNLKNGWVGEINASYQGPLASGIYKLDGIFSSNMGISKQFLKNQATLKLSVNDIFNTQKKVININYNGVVMEQQRKLESRFINLSINYKIGNKNVKSKKERTSKIEDLENRMTN